MASFSLPILHPFISQDETTVGITNLCGLNIPVDFATLLFLIGMVLVYVSLCDQQEERYASKAIEFKRLPSSEKSMENPRKEA